MEKDITKINSGAGLKRKTFFWAAGISAIGMYSIFKNPFKIFSGKSQGNESRLKISQNPNAVKRSRTV